MIILGNESQHSRDPDEVLSTDDFVVPFERNSLFTGRKEFLRILNQTLHDTAPKKYNNRVALYGMGGIGKTQTALEYVYANGDSYKRIYWITAVDQASLLSGYRNIAVKAELNNLLNLKPIDLAKGVLSWLRCEHRWLIVIDNLDDITIAAGFLPQNGPLQHTLITTRNPNAAGIPAEGLEVPLLTSADSVELLCTLSGITITNSPENEQAICIVAELGYLPLAIEQAAAYTREVAGDFITFLKDYHKIRREIYKWIAQGNRSYPHSVATTWLLSFNIVRSKNPQAAELLQLLSFLNPDGILIDFLEAGGEALPDELQKVVSNRIDMSKALIELETFSLIKWNRLTKTISIHRLVQMVVKDEMSDTDSLTLRTAIIDLFDQSFPQEWTNQNRQICRDYIGQVIGPLHNCDVIQTEKSAMIMFRVGWFLRDDGKFSDSERISLQAVKITIEILGDDHPNTLTTMNNLAETYRAQGKTEAAAMLHEEVLQKSRRILGDDHPDTLTTMSNLAETYQAQGKSEVAAALHEMPAKRRQILVDDRAQPT